MKPRRRALPLLLVAAGTALGACTDERIVFRDRDLTEGVPEAALGFVGYLDPAEGETVCGECHVGQASQWNETAHAGAWETLQESGHAQAFCEGCHTVNQLGNTTVEAGGYAVVEEERYHDVQCESCHGPGLSHVQNPDAGQPLAPVGVGTDLEFGCGECHSGAHHPFVEEWASSGHGEVLAYPAGRPECQSCHTGQGALRAFGVKAEYIERTDDEHLAITCSVCHDPHSSEFDGQLRFALDVPDEEQNLCMKCHHKRGTPDLAATNRGPHSPEGPMLLGDAGWWPPNMPYDPGERIAGTHGTEANPKLCAGCHVQSFEIEDELSGETIFTTGHLFQATPCVDASGRPIADDGCAQSEKSFQSCATSGCHGTPAAARSALTAARLRIARLNEELTALLAQVPASEFNAGDNRFSVAEGSRFNRDLAAKNGSVAHNPFLLEALLISSIDIMESTYGL